MLFFSSVFLAYLFIRLVFLHTQQTEVLDITWRADTSDIALQTDPLFVDTAVQSSHVFPPTAAIQQRSFIDHFMAAICVLILLLSVFLIKALPDA